MKMIMNTRKLIKMVKKWQQRAALHRKRISFQRSSSSGSRSTSVEKGCFVVYTADKARFAFPISYLSSSVFQELLKISEEEFGLPTEGPITLPFDSVFLEYLIKLVQRRMDEDTEKALLMSISNARCSSQCSLQLQDQSSSQHLLVF
ncbi:hypothetical protein N665_0518s0005 [Sinapis alba]|nr:hypothetical protein N665_0518s0005 [Sinapis alba]